MTTQNNAPAAPAAAALAVRTDAVAHQTQGNDKPLADTAPALPAAKT